MKKLRLPVTVGSPVKIPYGRHVEIDKGGGRQRIDALCPGHIHDDRGIMVSDRLILRFRSVMFRTCSRSQKKRQYEINYMICCLH